MRFDKVSRMTTESLLNSINSWAADRGLNFTAGILPAPPALLDIRPMKRRIRE